MACPCCVPPSVCEDCLDACAYFIQITSPGALAVISPTRDCVIEQSRASIDTNYLLPHSLPEEFSVESYANSGSSAGVSGALYLGTFLSAGANHIRWSRRVGPIDFNGLQVDSGVTAYVACWPTEAATPFRLYIVANVFVTMHRPEGSATASWIGTAEFALPSSCQSAPGRQCGDHQGEMRILGTPIEFTAGGRGTSLGPYQEGLGSSGVFAAEAEAIREELRDAIATGFRITSRPSCQAVGCSCSASLDGVTMSLYGQVFQIVGEPEPIRTIGQQRWEFQDGAVPTITYSVWDPFFIEEQVRVVAVLFCSSAQQNPNIPSDNAPAWYVITYADCFEWADNVVVAATRETWVGKFSCYELCGRHLPLGPPSPFVYVSRVTGEEVDACEPPPPPTVVLDVEACE